jgi:uncharacterized membrane protein YoaK (UPF0700 family)
VTYLKGFVLGAAFWVGVIVLVVGGVRTGDERAVLVAVAAVLVFLLAWRRLWRRRRRPPSRRIPISPAIRRRVYARDCYTCVYCGRRGRRLLLTIDHVFPVALGGTNDIGNLVTACRACNLTKGARFLDESGLRRFAEERRGWAGRERRRGCILRWLLFAVGAIVVAIVFRLLLR